MQQVKTEDTPNSSRDHIKTSPQQEAIRTYLNSRQISVSKNIAEGSGSDSR